METTLGGRILAAAILDKDFRSEAERIALIEECKSFCDFVTIYEQKEIENFLLVPDAITRATLRKISDQEKRVGRSINYETDMSQLLDDFAVEKKSYVTAQYVSDRRRFVRTISPAQSDATTTEDALIEFERCWKDPISRLKVIPGKDALSAINVALQAKYGVSVTATAIIDAMRTSEIAAEMTTLLNCLSTFASSAAY
jgi:hypothetical protein